MEEVAEDSSISRYIDSTVTVIGSSDNAENIVETDENGIDVDEELNKQEPQTDKICNLSGLTSKLISGENHQELSLNDLLSHVTETEFSNTDSITYLINYNTLLDITKNSVYQTDQNLQETSKNGVEKDNEGDINVKKKSYNCDLCDKSFSQENELDFHKRIHAGKRPFLCEKCGKGFNLKPALEKHKQEHKGDKPLICITCDKHFADLKDLISHQRTHSNAIFDCKICGQCFSSKSHLTSHSKTHEDGKGFKCNTCGKEFKMKRTLIAHEALHVASGPHVCVICSMEFTKLKDLIVHKTKHTDGLFECDICKKRFKSKGHLVTHQSIDAKDKPIICGICNQEFCRLNQLISHQTTHTGGKYQCERCGKGFQQKGHLTKHQMIYINEARQFCDMCGKNFCGVKQLVRHKLMHTEGKFECDICKKRFEKKFSLVKHSATHKKECKSDANVDDKDLKVSNGTADLKTSDCEN